MPAALAYRDQSCRVRPVPRRRLPHTSLSPLLTLSADARGSAPRLLSLRAEARLRALRLATTTFTYDPNGNLRQQVAADDEVMTYAWNADDRLVGIARDEEPVASYLYDAAGRRVAATSDTGTTSYLWDEANLLAELDEALDTLAQYTDFPGVWGGLSSVHAGGASAFFAPDLSSNIRLLLNAAGGVAEASLYSAFGVPLAVATASPLGFGGGLGYFDDGLDRLYVRARHYRPGLGAWMSRDPLGGLLGGYGYVGNSPVGWVDPSGWQRSPGLPPDSRYPESLPYVPRYNDRWFGADNPAISPSTATGALSTIAGGLTAAKVVAILRRLAVIAKDMARPQTAKEFRALAQDARLLRSSLGPAGMLGWGFSGLSLVISFYDIYDGIQKGRRCHKGQPCRPFCTDRICAGPLRMATWETGWCVLSLLSNIWSVKKPGPAFIVGLVADVASLWMSARLLLDDQQHGACYG